MKTIVITEQDLKRLRARIAELREARAEEPRHLQELERELDRATVVTPDAVPRTLVTMNSKVEVTDLASGERQAFTLVYPEEANWEEDRLSVLAPLGTAVLGYRAGDRVTWEMPSGLKRLKIEKVTFQPEAAGEYSL